MGATPHTVIFSLAPGNQQIQSWLQHLMVIDYPIKPSGLPELLRASFGHCWTAFHTLNAYFCTEFSTLTAYFEDEFSTPHPSFQTMLEP